MHVSNLRKKLGSHPDGSPRILSPCAAAATTTATGVGFVSLPTQGLYPSFTQG